MGKGISITAFVFSLLTPLLSIFLPFPYLIGLVLGIIALIQAKKDKKALKGLAVAAIVISLIFLLLNIFVAGYFFSGINKFNSMKQSITVQNKGLSGDEMSSVIDFYKYALNEKGYNNYLVRKSGADYKINFNDYNKEEIISLLSNSKFEAKIGSQVIINSPNDILSVCRNDAKCAGIVECNQESSTWLCRYKFIINISDDAANRISSSTNSLRVISEDGQNYLNETFDFFLNGQKINYLKIGENLKGIKINMITISGSANGTTQNNALNNAFKEMKNSQAIFSYNKYSSSVALI